MRGEFFLRERDMKILCLDSTAKIASCAILEDGNLLCEYTVHPGALSHSELLLPMCESLLSSCALSPDDIDLFACTAGPGSFTGVRIGVSVIKGLAFAKKKPCAEVSSLLALAENLFPLRGILCPVMDARRNQVYNALFKGSEGGIERITQDRAISLDDLAAELHALPGDEPIYLVGDGYGIAKEALAKSGVHPADTPLALRGQSAAAVGRCAYRMACEGRTVSDEGLRPVYLRLPQAERERLERLKDTNKGEDTK